MLLVAVLAIAGVGAYAFVPDVKSQIDSAIDNVMGRIRPDVIVHPNATASGVAGRDGSKAVDGNLATWWSADPSKPVKLSVTFQTPVKLRHLNFYSGPDLAQVNPLSEERPHHVEVQVAGAPSVTLELQDVATIQTFAVTLPVTAQLTIVIDDEYTTGGGKSVALREVEFLAAP